MQSARDFHDFRPDIFHESSVCSDLKLFARDRLEYPTWICVQTFVRKLHVEKLKYLFILFTYLLLYYIFNLIFGLYLRSILNDTDI